MKVVKNVELKGRMISMKSYLAVQVGYTEAFMNTHAVYNLIDACLPNDIKLSIVQNDLSKKTIIKMIGNGVEKDFAIDYGNVIVPIDGKLIILSMDNFLKYFCAFPNQLEKKSANLLGLIKCYSDEED